MQTTPFEEFMDDGARRTDKMLKKRIRKVLKLYSALYTAIAALVHEFYDEYTDVDRSVYKTLLDWGMGTGRIERLKSDVTKLYNDKMVEMRDFMVSSMEEVEKDAYHRMQYAMLWKYPDADMRELPQELLDLSVLGTDKAWNAYRDMPFSGRFGEPSMWMPKRGDIDSILQNDHSTALSAILASIMMSITSGMGITKTLSGLKEHVGKVVKVKNTTTGEEKTKVRGAAAKEVRVLRTEGNRLMNVGILALGMSLLGQPTVPTVRKMWVAILDSRTRAQSIEMNNQVRDLDEPYLYPNGATGMYPGDSGVPAYDINERCTSVLVVPDDESETGVNPYNGNEGPYSWSDYEDWSEMGTI